VPIPEIEFFLEESTPFLAYVNLGDKALHHRDRYSIDSVIKGAGKDFIISLT
jgi:hypothetical protein